MESVNFREFRKNLAGYLRQARQGEEILVTSRGEAVARLVPPAAIDRKRRQSGGLAGKIWIADPAHDVFVSTVSLMEIAQAIAEDMPFLSRDRHAGLYPVRLI